MNQIRARRPLGGPRVNLGVVVHKVRHVGNVHAHLVRVVAEILQGFSRPSYNLGAGSHLDMQGIVQIASCRRVNREDCLFAHIASVFELGLRNRPRILVTDSRQRLQNGRTENIQ